MANAERDPTLLLIDGNALVHRGFHALPPFRTPSGTLVQAVYGTLAVLLRAFREIRPTHAAAAFDLAAPTFRHRAFEEYKATRQKAPDELYAQFPLVKEALGVLGIPVVEKEGYEADDIIGTLTAQAVLRPRMRVVILSGDLDCLQLVGDRVALLTPSKGMRDTARYGPREVQERFGGLLPSQMADYKGLRGDPSDNLPGVRGIGEKTAVELLSRFGGLDELYAALDRGDAPGVRPRVAAALTEGRKDAKMSRQLAIIDTDVPLAFRLEDAAWRPADRKKLEAFLRRLEFSSLLPRIDAVADGEGSSGPAGAEEEADRLYAAGVLSPFLYDAEKALAPVLREMEARGIRISASAFHHLERELAGELRREEEAISQLAGEEFNINSPQQLSRILFEELGLSPRGLRKTPGGVVSTASSELEKLQDDHEIVGRVLAYRELAKLLNTYVRPLPELADERGRIHTTFDQFGTATGRLSSSSPNLQNVPVQGTWGEKIRKGFIPEEGSVFVSFDYSQIDLRVAAFLSGDARMQKVFADGGDIHAATASEVFGIPLEDVSREQRSQAKALNFGLLYGMGVRGFSRSAGVSIEEASAFIEAYEERFPGVVSYMEETKRFAREHGHTETLFGRKRFVPEISSSNPRLRAAAERAAINFPVQGTSADVIKIAMVDIAREMQNTPSWKMLLQIHDELLFEVAGDTLEEPARRIRSIMERSGGDRLALAVDVRTGPSWGELSPFNLP